MSAEAVSRLSGVDQPIAVEWFYSAAPQDCTHGQLTLPAGASVWQALLASGLVERLGLDLPECRSSGRAAGLAMAIWGRLCGVDATLRSGDRVELTRALQVDPKEARRLRYRRDGLKKKPPRRR